MSHLNLFWCFTSTSYRCLYNENIAGAFIPSDEASNYLAYGHYPSGHDALAESQVNFAVADTPLNNGSNLAGGQATLVKRRDQPRRKKQTTTPVLAVKKFTITT